MSNLRVVRRGDIYPGTAEGTIVRATAGGMEAFHADDRLYEGNLALPVTPMPGAGVHVGQFTIAQATVGLILLLGTILWMDRRVL